MRAASDGKASSEAAGVTTAQELIAIWSETETRDEQADWQRIRRKATTLTLSYCCYPYVGYL